MAGSWTPEAVVAVTRPPTAVEKPAGFGPVRGYTRWSFGPVAWETCKPQVTGMPDRSDAAGGPPQGVVYDAASAYPWAALNETAFLERFFAALPEALGSDLPRYRFHLLSSHDPHVVPAAADRPEPDGRLKVLLFLSDETGAFPAGLLSRYHAIFKCYIRERPAAPNLFPFNVGTVRSVPAVPPLPMDERTCDIFFSGNLHRNRFGLYRELHPLLRRLPRGVAGAAYRVLRLPQARPFVRTDFSDAAARTRLTFTGGFARGLPPEEYGRLLAASRIVLCPKGVHSTETFRHMEALRAGAAVITEPLPPTHFYRGGPFLEVANWGEGLVLARELLRSPERLAELQREGLRWWRDVCDEAATARYVQRSLAALR